MYTYIRVALLQNSRALSRGIRALLRIIIAVLWEMTFSGSFAENYGSCVAKRTYVYVCSFMRNSRAFLRKIRALLRMIVAVLWEIIH